MAVEEKEKLQKPKTKRRAGHSGTHGVLLFDCFCHTFDQVVLQLQKATGCSESQAVQYATLAEQFGEAMVYRGSESQCTSVARILSDIGLNVSVVPL